MISQVRKSCYCAWCLGWDKDHNSCCTGCHHLDRDHHCFCCFADELCELSNLNWLHWFFFSVVGDLQGLVSWAGNQRGSRLKEASPPALPKPGDPIIFFWYSPQNSIHYLFNNAEVNHWARFYTSPGRPAGWWKDFRWADIFPKLHWMSLRVTFNC